MFYSWQISLSILLNVYWISFFMKVQFVISYTHFWLFRLGGSCLFLDCLSFYYEIVEAFSILWQTCELKHLLIICDFLFHYLLMVWLPDFKIVHLSTCSFMVSAFVSCLSKLFQNRCHKDILLFCLQKALLLSFTFRATIYLNMILYIGRDIHTHIYIHTYISVYWKLGIKILFFLINIKLIQHTE